MFTSARAMANNSAATNPSRRREKQKLSRFAPPGRGFWILDDAGEDDRKLLAVRNFFDDGNAALPLGRKPLTGLHDIVNLVAHVQPVSHFTREVTGRLEMLDRVRRVTSITIPILVFNCYLLARHHRS